MRDGSLALVPADRKAEGLFLDLTLAANVGAASLGTLSRWGLLADADLERLAQTMIERLHIQPGEPRRPVRTFSGGNQQKALLGRCFAVGVKVLLADEPTRGVDIATKAEIHQLLRRFAEAGGGCLIYSSDLHEIGDIADRVLVLGRDGAVRWVSDARSAEELFALMSEAA
jgi:ribose transport system ATP-binding protein